MPPAVFQATYSDWRLVKGRKVVQVVFEIPLEQSNLAYEVLGGMPHPGESVWCAVARLQAAAAQRSAPALSPPSPEQGPVPGPLQSPAGPGRKSWHELAPSAQAGIRCHDPIFWAFLRESKSRPEVQGIATAEVAVREICGVESRSLFKTDARAAASWLALDDEFTSWNVHDRVTTGW